MPQVTYPLIDNLNVQVSQICINLELPEFVFTNMITDQGWLNKIQRQTLNHVAAEMSTKEKQKGLSRLILWTEPKSSVFTDLIDTLNFKDIKLMFDNPQHFINNIGTLTQKYFLAFPDLQETLVGLNLYYINKHVV